MKNKNWSDLSTYDGGVGLIDELKKYISKSGKTQVVVAGEIGIQHMTLSRWLHSQVKRIQPLSADALRRYLKKVKR